MIDQAYAHLFGTPDEAIMACRQVLKFDDQWPLMYFQIGDYYNWLHQYDKAIAEHEKAFEIYNKWGSKPFWVINYTSLGIAYHNNGQFKKEKELYKKAEKDFHDDPALIYRQAILSLVDGNMVEANGYIEKYKSIRKDNLWSQAMISTMLAQIYSEAGILDKAEVYYRQALILEPNKESRMNSLAYFLIDKDCNTKEGLELADKALGLSPEDYNYLHTKGWGLYKQGKYQEARDVLQKSWDLRMKNAIYDYTANLHLEEAKKAVARQ